MQPATHEHRLRVRYAETDQMGVVHHAAYVLYLEDARTRMMEHHGCPYAQIERSGYGLVVRQLALRYRSPARYDDELAVTTRLARVRGASLLFDYRIERALDRELLATAETELACVSLRTQPARPTLLPAELRERFEALLGGPQAGSGSL